MGYDLLARMEEFASGDNSLNPEGFSKMQYAVDAGTTVNLRYWNMENKPLAQKPLVELTEEKITGDTSRERRTTAIELREKGNHPFSISTLCIKNEERSGRPIESFFCLNLGDVASISANYDRLGNLSSFHIFFGYQSLAGDFGVSGEVRRVGDAYEEVFQKPEAPEVINCSYEDEDGFVDLEFAGEYRRENQNSMDKAKEKFGKNQLKVTIDEDETKFKLKFLTNEELFFENVIKKSLPVNEKLEEVLAMFR